VAKYVLVLLGKSSEPQKTPQTGSFARARKAIAHVGGGDLADICKKMLASRKISIPDSVLLLEANRDL